MEYFALLAAVVSSQVEGGALEKEAKDAAERAISEREFIRRKKSVLPPGSCNTSPRSSCVFTHVDVFCLSKEFKHTLLRSSVGATKPISSTRSHPAHQHALTTAHTFQPARPSDTRPLYAKPNTYPSALSALERPPEPSASLVAGDLPRNLRDSSKLYVTEPAERNMALRYASAALVLACFFASIVTGESVLHRLHRVTTGV